MIKIIQSGYFLLCTHHVCFNTDILLYILLHGCVMHINIFILSLPHVCSETAHFKRNELTSNHMEFPPNVWLGTREQGTQSV